MDLITEEKQLMDDLQKSAWRAAGRFWLQNTKQEGNRQREDVRWRSS